MSHLINDLRYAFRMIARSPGFAVLVVGILAVGIAANTAVFSVVNAVMLRPLPYQASERLVTLLKDDSRWCEEFTSRKHFPFWQENNEVFEDVGGWCRNTLYVEGIDTPHEISGCEVTANLFTILGMSSELGRGFLPEDETPQGGHVVILSHEFWQAHLGGVPDILGQDITLAREVWKENDEKILQRQSYTIVGVMPAGSSFPLGRSISLWRPLSLSENNHHPLSDTIFPLARLKKGITQKEANANLGVLATQLRQIDPDAKVRVGMVRVVRLLDSLVEGHRKLPLLLLGAAGFVLLIACSNAASLFLARASVRQREMAMRVALGASRGRIVKQVLTESLLLSLTAGALGVMLTFAVIKILVSLCPADVPRLQETSIDLTVLGFTLTVSVITGLIFGLVPAWRASDVSVHDTLKEVTGRTTTSRRWRWFHGGLVVSQLGLSLILLIGAALLIRSLISLTSVDVGFQPDRVLAIHIALPQVKYTEESQNDGFFWSLLDRLRVLPGVDSVGAFFNGVGVDYALGSADLFEDSFTVADQGDSAPLHIARFMLVTPDYFATMGIPFLRGQTLTAQGPDNVVIDEAYARKCFGNTDPVGQTLLFHGPGGQPLQVIGVVATVRSFDTPEPGRGVVYARGRGFGNGFAVVLARTVGPPENLAPAIRAQVAELEKDQVIETMESLGTTLSRMLAPERFVMLLLTLFAGIALVLAMVGLYGLLQYSAVQQTHDIGIRMALGAERSHIRWMVLRRGLTLTLIGIVVGIAGAVALTRVLSSLLYQVTPTDPTILLSVSIVLSGIALLAGYLPARRAAKIDPMVALRYE